MTQQITPEEKEAFAKDLEALQIKHGIALGTTLTLNKVSQPETEEEK